MQQGSSALTANLIASVGLVFCSKMSVVRGLSRMVLMQATGSADITEVKELTDDLSGRKQDDAVYDFYGRRIQSAILEKGVYIVNGKKVLIE